MFVKNKNSVVDRSTVLKLEEIDEWQGSTKEWITDIVNMYIYHTT